MTQNQKSSLTQAKINEQRIYMRTSDRMVLQIWQGYTAKHWERGNNTPLVHRLRIAHMLLLQLNEVYFSQQHKEPSIASQQWLVRKALNDRCQYHWHIICIPSG